MGIVHQQRYQRDRTIDAQSNARSDPYAEAFRAVDSLMARIDVQLDRLEVRVTRLEREALQNAVTVTPVTPVTRRHVVPGLDPDIRDAARRHARNERQRRYLARKKQRPGI